MGMHSIAGRDEIHALVLELAKAGEGPTAVAKALNSAGFRTSRGTPWSRARAAQLIGEVMPGSAAVRELKRYRHGLGPKPRKALPGGRE